MTGWMLVAALLSAFAASESAHASSLLAPGARIRWVSATGSDRPTVGRAVTVTSDTLTAVSDRDSSSHVMAFSSLASLEVSRGRRNQSLRYAFSGAAGGAGLAVAIAWIVGAAVEESANQTLGVRPEGKTDYTSAALIGGGIGAAAGAIVGAVRKGPERWEPVSAADRRLGILIRAGARPALGLALRY
jgi:hypothetical protein